MLILSRRVGEVAYIYSEDLRPKMTVAELFASGQIAIEVIEVKGTQVRFGIDAPEQLKILRDDVNEK